MFLVRAKTWKRYTSYLCLQIILFCTRGKNNNYMVMFIFLCLSVYSIDISGVLNFMPSSVLMWNAQDRYGSYHHRAFNSIGKKWWSPKQRLLNEITLFWQQDEPLAHPSNSSAYILSVTCRRVLCLRAEPPYTHTQKCLFAYIIWNQISMSRIVLSISKK